MAGKIFVISGPSGVGKGTVAKKLFDLVDNLQFSVSCTTRKIRPNEIDGVHYTFISNEQFDQKLERGEFLETTERYGNRYGTDKLFIEKTLSNNVNVLLDIDVVGAVNIKRVFPNSILIFLAPPSLEVLFKRIEGRGTETPEQLITRKKAAEEEMSYIPEYDYIVVNDVLDDCVQEVAKIVSLVMESD